MKKTLKATTTTTITTKVVVSRTFERGEIINLLRASGLIPSEGAVIMQLENEYGEEVDDLCVTTTNEKTEQQ